MGREKELYPGDICWHFKGNLYQVAAVAEDSETGESMVVYQALYGNYKVYVRPYSMFMEELDPEGYPDAAQKHRFERVNMNSGQEQPCNTPERISGRDTGIPGQQSMDEGMVCREGADQEPAKQEDLIAFLDAGNCRDKLDILVGMEKHLDEHILNSIAVSLDLAITEDGFEDRLEGVKDYLKTRIRFEDVRLR